MTIIRSPAPVPAPPPPPPPLPVAGPRPLPAPPPPVPVIPTLGASPVTLVDQTDTTVVRTKNIGFGIINITDSNTVRATTVNDTVTFVGSPGLSIGSISGTKTITWSFNGVISLSAGNGIQVNNSSGAVTVTNTGILAVSSGNGISVATVNGNTTVTNTGILNVNAGNGISVGTANGNATVTNTGILNVNAGNSINVVVTNGNATVTNTFTETVYNGGNATGNVTPDRNNGSIQKFTLTGNITLLPVANIAAGQWITLVLTQDSTGGRLLDANTAYLFASGFQTLTIDSGAIDMLNVFYDGTNYYATLTVDYS
jgi:hypothetical protein